MRNVLTLSFVPTSVDLGLLLLRLWYGIPLLWLHGWPKLAGYSQMSGGFPDPLGVGSQVSLIGAIFAEVLCSILLILGLFTRLAAIGAAIVMGVAFWGVHGMLLKGEGNGELAFVYLGVFVALLLTGPGRFSMDGRSGTAKVAKA